MTYTIRESVVITYPLAADELKVPYPILFDCNYTMIIPDGYNFSLRFIDEFGLDVFDSLTVGIY